MSMTSKKALKLVEKYQCPGCMLGSDVECGSFEKAEHGDGCDGHVLGSRMSGVGVIALGLPRGFNRAGRDEGFKIRIFDTSKPEYNKLNLPVWAMEHDGDVLVRTYLPRTNRTFVDVIGDGAKDGLPKGAIDVGEFHGEID